MKRIFAVCFIFFAAAYALNAQVRIGLSGGYSLPSDSNIKGGIAFGFQAGVGLGENFAVEASFGYISGDVTGTDAGLSTGKLTRMPIELSLQGRFPLGPTKRVVPYVFAGGGYAISKFDLDSTFAAAWSNLGMTIAETANGGFAFHVGAGIDVFIADKIALNFNAKYLFQTGKATWSQTDTGTDLALSGTLDGLNWNALSLNAGLKFFF